MAVGVLCLDGKTQRIGRLERRRSGRDFEALQPRVVVARTRRAGGNPVADDLEIVGIGFEPLAAAVWQLSRWLQQHQALRGLLSVDTTCASLARQHKVVA